MMAMEYDVTLLDLDGHPLEFVALDAPAHMSLIDEARRLNLRRTLQIGDFHNDGSIHADDVNEFLRELSLIEKPELRSTLADLRKIASRAIELNRALIGLAD